MKKIVSALAGSAIVLALGASAAYANHSWGNYHWGRTANPFTLELGDNLSPAWDPYLATAASDWSLSSVLDLVVKPGKTKPQTCKATNGRVEVCNSKYGANGWLGIAQIWVSGDHIMKGTTKVNDTYFNTPTYNTPAWRALVLCQEVGHMFGLDHQDEIFDNPNLDTCMDYTNNPESNQHPNAHDYEELETIYAHLDGINTVIASGTVTLGGKSQRNLENVGQDSDLNDPSAWGTAVRQDAQGKNAIYVRDLGSDEKLFTFVVWAQ
jgi:hypothetical protein